MTNDSRKTLIDCHSRLQTFCQNQLNTFITAAIEYLFQQAEQANDNDTQQRYFDIRQTIETEQTNLTKQFEKKLSALFAVLITPSAQAHISKKNSDHILSLLGNDEIEINAALASMSHRAEADYAEALFALGQRLALLNNGIKVGTENNPFSPQALCNNFMHCINALPLELQSRLILLKLFDRYFIKQLATLYAEINLHLVNNRILPNLRYHHRSDRSIAPKRRKSDSVITKASEGRQSELFEVMRSIVSAHPVSASDQTSSISVERLIAELSALQAQQLIRFNDTSTLAEPIHELPRTNIAEHQQAIECVGVLFEHILNDDSLHDTVKSLLSHLHTPLLKLALLDETFLSNPRHDARQLVNQLITAGEYWLTDDASTKNDIYQHMQSVVKKIITDFDHDNSSQIFSYAASNFNTYIEKIERQASITEKRSIQAAQGKEALASVRKKVTTLINEKISNELLPKPVLQLITQPWSAFLAYTLLRHTENSPQWHDAVNVIDELLWYIEPKIENAEIQQAKNIRSALNKKLTYGLSSVGLDANEIQQCLSSVEMCSKLATENVQQPQETIHTQKTNKPAVDVELLSTKKRPPNVSGFHLQDQQQEQLQKKPQQQQNPVIDTTKTICTADGQTKMTELPPESTVPERASEKAIDDILSMDFGTWFNWQKPNEPSRRLKLTWYNKKTQNCMLSNSMGQQVAIMSANEIVLGMNNGWITINDTHLKKPFFERMLETVVDRLRVNAQSA